MSSVPGELPSLRWEVQPWGWQPRLLSIISWPGQTTHRPCVYCGIIRVSIVQHQIKRLFEECFLQFMIFFNWNLSESTCQAPWRQLEGPDALRMASPPHGTMITPKLSSASADELFHTFGHSVTLGVAFSCFPPSCVHDFLLEGRARGDYTWHIWHIARVERSPREWVQTMKQSVRSKSGQPLWVLLSCPQIVWPLGSNIWDHVRVLSRSVMSDSLQPYGLEPTRLLCPWDSPGKNPGVGCHSLLQGVFLAQGLILGLLLCRRILYHLSHQGSRPFEAILVCLSQRISTTITG